MLEDVKAGRGSSSLSCQLREELAHTCHVFEMSLKVYPQASRWSLSPPWNRRGGLLTLLIHS